MEKKAKAKTTTTREKAAKKKAPRASTASKAPRSLSAKRSSNEKPCSVSGCKREYRAKGYCGVHYKKWRHGAFGSKRFTACSDYGCTKPMAMNRHGLCEDHFQSYYVKGVERARPVEEAPASAPAEKSEEKVA